MQPPKLQHADEDAKRDHSVLAASLSDPEARRAKLFIAWLLALPVLLIGIGRPEVTRTQEARVLEVARQAMGGPAIGWIIPKINGELRLQKPPLPYWLTGIAYAVAGVNEGVGRAPTAILGWLTLAATYCAAKWLFGRRAGFLSAGALLGSYFFARHTRLAETDAPAMLFVTIAIYALWRGNSPYIAVRSIEGQGQEDPNSQKPHEKETEGDPTFMSPSSLPDWVAPPSRAKQSSRAWLHLGAAMIALAIMSKGGPGAFPVLFLIAMAIVERNISILTRFVTSGAIVTLALLAAPWFVFVGHHEGWATFIFEMRNVEGGFDHHAPPTYYLPAFAVAAAPWSAIGFIALIAAAFNWRDPKLRGLLLWFGSIVVPLCFIGNKQNHYLIPALPVSMILVGWVINRAIESPKGPGQITRITLRVMLALLALGAVGAMFASRLVVGAFARGDAIASGSLASAVAIVALIWLRRGESRGILAMVIACAALLPPLVMLWIPTLSTEHTRQTAQLVQNNFGDSPLCCLGPNQSIPLCFNLRRAIPYADVDSELRAELAREPDAIFFTINKDGRPSRPPTLVPFEKIKTLNREDQVWDFYRLIR